MKRRWRGFVGQSGTHWAAEPNRGDDDSASIVHELGLVGHSWYTRRP